MKNKEMEEILNKIKNAIKKHKEEDLQDDMLVILELDVIQWNLLLSYIEQLENNRDKAIERCDFYNKKYQKDPLGNQKVLFVINNVMNILKGEIDVED